MFVANYDASGNVVWALQAGGTGAEFGTGLALDGSGNSFITGQFGGAADFGDFTLTSAGGTDIFIAKLGPSDTDGDGIPNDDDLCPGTSIPEAIVPSVRLGTNRWALVDDDFDFDTKKPKGNGPNRSYNTTDTGGCSCEQIIAAQGLGNGHTKFGCSISAMDDWVALVAGVPKRGAGADVAEVAGVPEAYVLEANYPSPFNPQTTIRFGMPESAQVRLVVYDVLGRPVRVLVDGTREAGTHEVVFEASDLPSGTYLVRLVTPAGSFVQTMQLMK